MLVYLASPYSHKSKKIQRARFRDVCIDAAHLMDIGYQVFCPIAHTHPLTEYTSILNDKDGDWWLEQDYPILDHCDALVIDDLIMGWDKSEGLYKETVRCLENEIPILFFSDIIGDFLAGNLEI